MFLKCTSKQDASIQTEFDHGSETLSDFRIIQPTESPTSSISDLYPEGKVLDQSNSGCLGNNVDTTENLPNDMVGLRPSRKPPDCIGATGIRAPCDPMPSTNDVVGLRPPRKPPDKVNQQQTKFFSDQACGDSLGSSSKPDNTIGNISVKNHGSAQLSGTDVGLRPPRKPPDFEFQNSEPSDTDVGLRPPRKPPDFKLNKPDEVVIRVNQTDGVSFTVPVEINGVSTAAVVDSAAMVTVLSEELIDHLQPPPTRSKLVKLKGIGEQIVPAYYVTDLRITIGGQVFVGTACVAPVKDPLLLGLDFLMAHHCSVDFSNKLLTIGDTVVRASLEVGPASVNLKSCSQVYPTRRVVLAPNTATRMVLKVPENTTMTSDLMLEPVPDIKGLLVIPTFVPKGSTKFCVGIINDQSVGVRLTPSDLLGELFEVEPVSDLLESGELDDGNKISQITSDTVSDQHHKGWEVKASLPSDVGLEELLKMTPPPPHLTDLFEKSKVDLTREQAETLARLLIEYQDVFAQHDLDLGCYTGTKHRINTGDAPPVKHKLRRTPINFQSQEEEHLSKMLAAGVIQPSDSDWASAPVLVRKKDGQVRWCIDYRALNDRTVKDSFPLPNIEDCLDTLHGNKYFSTLDMASGYYQIDLAPEDRKKTAFITRYGLFEHTRMGFGLCNAPATFQRAMQLVLQGLNWHVVLAYLDDIVVLGKSFISHLQNLEQVFRRFRQCNLKLKPKKCVLLKCQVSFLGRLVTQDGVFIDPNKQEVVQSWPPPVNTHQLQVFLGFVNYLRDHIPHFAEKVLCLYELSRSKSLFVWEEEHQEAFDKIKAAIASAQCLSYPSPEASFILDTDASNKTIGAALSQIQNGKEVPICFASHVLIKAQRNYCTTRKELLAVVKFTRVFRHYLLGKQFLVRTDHGSLVWLLRFKHIEGQLARWIEELSQYDMKVVHRPGKKHLNADGLSRVPDSLTECDCYSAGTNPESLPCGGCKYCTRAHNQWARFNEDVDDVVPLAVRSVTDVMTAGSESNPSEEESYASDEESSTNDCVTASWLQGCVLEDVKTRQKEDSDLGPIIQWLSSSETPSQAELYLQSPGLKALWRCRSQLEIIDGILFYKWEHQPFRRNCLVVPTSLKDDVLSFCHNLKSSGHHGQTKTLKRLKASFMWYNMSRDCKAYVQSCRQCNLNKKASRTARAALGTFHAGYPMERVHLDILGPFRPSEHGNVYILMMIDQFTKWVEMSAIPTQSAEVVAEKFIAHFVSTFGCPLEVHTDQGRNFESNLFKAFCDTLQITKTRTTPYHPSSNGQIERINRTVLQMIRCFIEGKNQSWDRDLPLLTMALHSTENRNTGFTPNQMMLGREVFHPADLIMGTASPNMSHFQPAEWVQHLSTTLHEVHKLARENLRSSIRTQKRLYDTRLQESVFNPGDVVYLRDSSTKVKISTKLRPIWKGPYLVVLSRPPLYHIQDRRKTHCVHHDRLKLCRDRRFPGWLKRLRHSYFEGSSGESMNDSGDFECLANLFADPSGASSQSGNDDSEEVPVTSRTGRKIKRPRYLTDYYIDEQ